MKLLFYFHSILMMINLIKYKKVFLEFLFLFLFLFIFLCFHIFYMDVLKDFNEEGVSFLFLISPVLFLYFLFRTFFPVGSSFLIVTSLVLAIDFANREKISKTGDVLYFNDIFSVNNFLVVKQYIGLGAIFLMLMVLSIVILLLFIERRNSTGVLLFNFGISAFFSIFLILNISVIVDFFPTKLVDWANLNKRSYISWDIHENLNKNGLPLHLVQTSAAVIPKSTKKEKILFDEILGEKTNSKKLMKGSVFVLLCESCWFDKENFNEIFNPLLDVGFKELRAISPVYGGGTVNSALEVLTGIPSKSNLSGIVYQEYKDALSENIYSIPNELNRYKIKSYAFHNFHDDFWNRKTIMKKMGFDEYFGLSSMKRISDDGFPRDKIMYDFVLSKFKAQGFYYMEGVHGHGPYESVDDYRNKMENVVSDFKEFFVAIRKIDTQSKFLIYSDHKPALNDYFKDKNLIAEDSFVFDGGEIKGFKSKVFKDKLLSAEVYDVPVLFSNQVDDEYDEFFENANGKPLFCLSGVFSEYYLSLSLPSHVFNKSLCQSEDWFIASQGGYPEWITANSLFN